MPRKLVKPEKGIVVKDPSDEKGISFVDPPLSSYYILVGDPKELGLLGMRERVIAAGGEFTAHSKPSQGTQIDVRLAEQRQQKHGKAGR